MIQIIGCIVFLFSYLCCDFDTYMFVFLIDSKNIYSFNHQLPLLVGRFGIKLNRLKIPDLYIRLIETKNQPLRTTIKKKITTMLKHIRIVNSLLPCSNNAVK